MTIQRQVRWDEPRARKLFRHPRWFSLPGAPGWVVGTDWKTVPMPGKTRRTVRRRRMLRVKLEDGTTIKAPCLVRMEPKRKGGGVTARVTLGSRRVTAQAANLRGVWHRVLVHVERLLAEEQDINKLKCSPKRRAVVAVEDYW